MIPVYPVPIIREADRFTIEEQRISSSDLMERASFCFCRFVETFLENGCDLRTGRAFQLEEKCLGTQGKPRFIVFVGKGNNGGDGLAIARILWQKGYEVQVWVTAKPGPCSPDAQINLERWLSGGSEVSVFGRDGVVPDLKKEDILIDALVGTGLRGPLDPETARVVDFINGSGCRVFSVDIPSGLLADEPTPENWPVVRNSFCVSFQFVKEAFLWVDSDRRPAGFSVIDIGLSSHYVGKNQPWAMMTEISDFKDLLPVRSRFGHKGCYGKILILAGKEGMAGAAVLAGRAALRTGSGLVYISSEGGNRTILQTAVPEAVYVDPDRMDEKFIHSFDVLAAGPGMSTSDQAAVTLRRLVSQVCPDQVLVLDADALNLMAMHRDILDLLHGKKVVLTPHPGEFARLVGASVHGWDSLEKQQDFCNRYGVVMVLKGAHTCITFPDSGESGLGRFERGIPIFNSTGNPGMATGGSGDVLTGMLASLAGQLPSLGDAVVVAVALHGLSGDLASARFGEYSLCAGDIVDYIPEAIQRVMGLRSNKK